LTQLSTEDYKIRRQVQKWASDSDKKGLGAVHKYSKQEPKKYEAEVIHAGELMVLPRQVAKCKAEEWKQRWMGHKEDAEELKRVMDELIKQEQKEKLENPPQKLTVVMLDLALKATKSSTGLGVDQWGPEDLKNAPTMAKQQLVDLMNEWERDALIPFQLLYNKVKLIPKPEGGGKTYHFDAVASTCRLQDARADNHGVVQCKGEALGWSNKGLECLKNGDAQLDARRDGVE
jgi:hypothetical protein